MRNFIEPRGGACNLRGAIGLLVGGGADFLGKLVDFGDDAGDLAQRDVEFLPEHQSLVHNGRALLHVVDGVAGFLLNALDQFGNFLSRLGRFFRQLADFVGDHREAKSVFTGAGRFDGCIQRQQVGLFGEVIDDFDDLADVVGALAEGIDNLPERTGSRC